MRMSDWSSDVCSSGLHWICFFHAIKASTVSVTLVCLSSQTLFTSLLEPLFNRKRFSGLDVLTGLMIIVGIFLIFHFEAGYTEGIISALLAALLACLFTIFNSCQLKRNDPDRKSTRLNSSH